MDDMMEDETEYQEHQERLAEARRILVIDQERREQVCLEEVTAVLRKHGMRMSVTPAQIVISPAGD